MTTDRIRATYQIETAYPVLEAAEALAGEQSSGTFTSIPWETDELQKRHRARVEDLVELDVHREPSLPGTTPPEHTKHPTEYTVAEVTLSFPVENVGHCLPNLRTTLAGNGFELRELSGIRIKEIELPSAFADAFPGPQFGIDGTREIVDVWDRPIIGTIIKPSVGLKPTETGELVSDLVESGLDFIKDDELIANPPYSRVEKRVEEVMAAIHRHENEAGKEVMYACNITGDVETMLDLHDKVKDAGGNCVMVSINSVGLSGLLALRKEADLPIHAHRNGWGALSRHPFLGFDYAAFQKFWRLAGADHMHVNGLRNKFSESDASVIRSARTCQSPIADESDTVMPVFSSNQWAGQAPDTYDALGNVDLMYLCGGGILGHPDGPDAGVKHLKQGWEAAMNDIPLEDHAEDHEELRTAIDFYGPLGSRR